MPLSKMKNKLEFGLYRMSTIAKSLKALYKLPPEKVDAFLNSYNIYDHDWSDEKQLIEKMGADYYQEIKRKLVDYYSVLNHLCSIGQVEKMYIPPAMDLSKNIIANQTLFEKKMCQDLGISKGNQVLDVGCGRGRVANHVASHTGAHVTGVNIDLSQLEAARKFAASKNMSQQCEFKQWDLNEIPFPFEDNSLDAIYQIQVFSLSKDLLKLFKEIYRMLKPGGKFACLDWVSLEKYDPKDPYHAELMRRIKPLIGAIGTPSTKEYVNLMKAAGFEILIEENPSIDGLQAPLIENADKFFTRVTKLINFLVRTKILPAHFKALFDRLTKDGETLVEADRLRLVTTTYYIVGQKK
ncbi:MAG TPA: methyltransferase domain-containing protein [Rhabdochlamydiaceae bacterium]|nr:methyltransferase domain-containing protein [Rhabdochlamydiaceae bacterium]